MSTDLPLIQISVKRKLGCFEIKCLNIAFEILWSGKIILVLNKIVCGSNKNSQRTKTHTSGFPLGSMRQGNVTMNLIVKYI